MPKNISRLLATALVASLLLNTIPVEGQCTGRARVCGATEAPFDSQALSEALSFFFHPGSINLRAAVLAVSVLAGHGAMPGHAQSLTDEASPNTLHVTMTSKSIPANDQIRPAGPLVPVDWSSAKNVTVRTPAAEEDFRSKINTFMRQEGVDPASYDIVFHEAPAFRIHNRVWSVVTPWRKKFAISPVFTATGKFSDGEAVSFHHSLNVNLRFW